MKKEECDKMVAEHTNKPIGFCPAIRSKCRLDCASYCVARAWKQYGEVYVFMEESCSSPLVTGLVESYNQ